MRFSGKAITKTERNRLLSFAKPSKADECCIGVMKTENGQWIPVARFFKNDIFLFYITL